MSLGLPADSIAIVVQMRSVLTASQKAHERCRRERDQETQRHRQQRRHNRPFAVAGLVPDGQERRAV